MQTIALPARRVPVVGSYDVLVVGGGPAGVAAAVAAARSGASTGLVERYPYLGGLASGGMVLVLDDLTNEHEITVSGINQEYIDRMSALGLAVTPPPEDWGLDQQAWRRWSHWGTFDFRGEGPGKQKPITYAAAFDPDAWKRVSNDLVSEAGVHTRLHSWFTESIMDGEVMTGIVCESKEGPGALLATVVVDATGDLDVGARSGAAFTTSQFKVTPVFRLGGVDADRAEEFEFTDPRAAEVNRRAKRILGGAWDIWWMRTPLPGTVWCNCPHLSDVDGTSVDDLTRVDFVGRRRMAELLEYVRSAWPGFENAYIVDVAPQVGVRSTRLLEGDYVVTKDDILTRRHFADAVARGRDYYTPFRALLPKSVEQLLVAGRHYSATQDAQRIGREIGPCIAQGQAAGVAAALAAQAGHLVRHVDVPAVQKSLRDQGADPGDRPSPNASVDAGSMEASA